MNIGIILVSCILLYIIILYGIRYIIFLNNTKIQSVSEYFNIINYPRYEQIASYIYKYLTSKDYFAVGEDIDLKINIGIPPTLTKNNTVIEYQTEQNSGSFGYISSLYSKLFIDKRVLLNIDYTLLKTIIISELVFNITFNQKFTDPDVWIGFNVISIGTVTKN